MSQSRQLAAIMFTDIVGYTALMGDDEEKAFEILNKNRQLQKPLIEKFNGTWIKELGDGVMASFNTVSDAVNSAIKIQNDCNSAGNFQLRIGIHHGEVVFEKNDIFGDAVNIASRIQALAPIGGIWISESVHNNVSNKKDINTKFVRAETLKNVKEPIKIYEIILNDVQARAVFPSTNPVSSVKRPHENSSKILIAVVIVILLAAGYFIYSSLKPKTNSAITNSTEVDKSIAVLPFLNMSNDKEQEYLSDGLSEELLNLLAKVPRLKVIARTSSFAFKGKNEDIRTISEKLGVGYILEGSLRKSGNKLRISVQLIKTTDGSHLWSQTYDRVMDDIFIIQDEVAAAVVKELKLKLSPAAQHGSSKSNIAAYNLILQGNYFYDKLDKENLQKSVDFYRQALAIDSTDAKAWAYLANSLSRMAWNNDIDQLTGYEEAREAALKAIAFDANTAAGHRALGAIKFYHDFDWRGAKEEFEKALNIELNNAEVLSVYSVWHQAMGDYTTAISLTKEALSNDPLKPLYYRVYGGNLTYVSRLEDAIAMFRKGLELNPHSLGENYLIGRNYILMGKPEKALAFFSNEPFEMSKQMGYNLYYHATGRKKEANEALVNFINKYHEVWPYNIAVIYGFRGDKNNTINWLEKAFNQKDTRLVLIKNDPLLKSVWNDPRYISLLKKMNLLN